MYSHALLLRLFLSHSFFSVHVALQYLRLYTDHIGITHYLTGRLRELPASELQDVWGFICHLLVAQPSKSVALECFVVERAEQSTHTALLTFWFMQAFLHDLALTRRDTPSFLVCQRVLQTCHDIIFGELPPPAPYASPCSTPSRSRFLRKKVGPRLAPTLVGMGCVLAGAVPQLAESTGKVAIEQGRWGEDGPRTSVQDDDAPPGVQVLVGLAAAAEDSEEEEEEAAATPAGHDRGKRSIGPAQTTPALLARHQATMDPLGQLDEPSSYAVSTPVLSSLSSSTTTRRHPNHVLSADFLLQKYDLHSQSLLLRSHYMRGEVQFVLALETIANRLLVVPRPARISALRAELTNLNHKLPLEVCIPLWCDMSEKGVLQPHHRVVRIPPGESVVLNSAERAPYLLIVEILHDDLDFDPSKRKNTEILRKMVLQEAGHVAKERPDWTEGNAAKDDGVLELKEMMMEGPIVVPATPLEAPPEEEEEMDVVEQLYGSDLSLRPDASTFNNSIALPTARKNKDLDLEVWSKMASMPPSPGSNLPSFLEHTRSPSDPRQGPSRPFPAAPRLAEGLLRGHDQVLSLEDYSERMRTAAVMLAQLNANVVREPVTTITVPGAAPSMSEASGPLSALRWIPGSSWIPGVNPTLAGTGSDANPPVTRMRLSYSEAQIIRDRIMQEMMALEEERMDRMRASEESGIVNLRDVARNSKATEDEKIIRQELNKSDPSAAIFRESWVIKKKRIKSGSPYGHLVNWDCVSLIVKTGADLRQEQLAVQLIREFDQIWKEEKCSCWVRCFRILITGPSSGLVETVTDAMSIHSLKKAEYARRLAEGRLDYVTLMDHFVSTYGDPSSAKFARAQRSFAQSLAGYSIITYLLQIKDRHNGNILLDREGHLIHIDFGFMLSNSPGNIGFEAAPFKLPSEYVEVLGGIEGPAFLEFKRLFREGFEAARKHCDRILTLVELMQKDSTLPCFAAFKEQTAGLVRERFQPALTHALVGEYVERLIVTSLGSAWTRLYDSYQYYSQSIL